MKTQWQAVNKIDVTRGATQLLVAMLWGMGFCLIYPLSYLWLVQFLMAYAVPPLSTDTFDDARPIGAGLIWVMVGIGLFGLVVGALFAWIPKIGFRSWMEIFGALHFLFLLPMFVALPIQDWPNVAGIVLSGVTHVLVFAMLCIWSVTVISAALFAWFTSGKHFRKIES